LIFFGRSDFVKIIMNASLADIHFDQESSLIDRALGFEIKEIEGVILSRAKCELPDGNHRTWGEKIHQGSQTWVGLHEEVLQTPYPELKEACDFLRPRPGESFVDLGCGYGRLGILLERFYPGVKFLGYELVPERVVEGNRIFKKFGCEHAHLYEQDLTDFDFVPPDAQYYFLYDYGKVAHIRSTLEQLSSIADSRHFSLVARGKGVRSLVERDFPWLLTHAPFYMPNFTIYRTSLGQS
jgi:SAM-dependent methyltransferase